MIPVIDISYNSLMQQLTDLNFNFELLRRSMKNDENFHDVAVYNKVAKINNTLKELGKTV